MVALVFAGLGLCDVYWGYYLCSHLRAVSMVAGLIVCGCVLCPFKLPMINGFGGGKGG